MPTLEDYPDNCRQSILTVSEALKTDIETAYAAILLTACLSDYYPYQREVVDEILANCKRVKLN